MRDGGEKLRCALREVRPKLNRPRRCVSLSTIPAESFRRSAYSPGYIPTGKRKLTRSSFGGRCIWFGESLASSPRVGEKEAKSTVTASGAITAGACCVAARGCGSARCSCEMLGSPRPRVLFQTSLTTANRTASTARDAAVTLMPRTTPAIRRSLEYSWKQGEQLTTCETGMSFKLSCRSRYAIARKVEESGQPSRVGFGNAVLEAFFPRATTSLTCLADMDWVDSVSRSSLAARRLES